MVERYVSIKSPWFHSTDVGVRIGYKTCFFRNVGTLLEDTFVFILKDVGSQFHFVIKHFQVYTNIHFGCLFPVQVIGTYAALANGATRPCYWAIIGRHSRKVREADFLDTVITYFTQRSSEFEEIEERKFFTRPFILSRHPSQSYCREPPVAVAFLELLGTGISYIEFKHISILIRISSTSRNSLITFRNGTNSFIQCGVVIIIIQIRVFIFLTVGIK